MTTLQEILPAISAAQSRGEGGVVVAVVEDRSSLSMPTSARMLVPPSGEAIGTISCQVDSALILEARRRFAARKSGLASFHVEAGGVERVSLRDGDLDVFFEVLERRPSLVIVGAGHIAVPLAQLAHVLDFHVTVLDDRPEYASEARFPNADTIVVGEYAATLAGLPISSDTYVVLVTRGHVHDRKSLEQVLGGPAPYIGMIGSKRRVQTVIEHLSKLGRAASELEQLYAPVGLDIGSRTPAEIALAILAEIVSVRRGGRAPSLRLKAKSRA